MSEEVKDYTVYKEDGEKVYNQLALPTEEFSKRVYMYEPEYSMTILEVRNVPKGVVRQALNETVHMLMKEYPQACGDINLVDPKKAVQVDYLVKPVKED